MLVTLNGCKWWDLMSISWDISGILVDIPSGNSMAGNFPSSRSMILQHMASSGISRPCLMTPEGRSLHFALKDIKSIRKISTQKLWTLKRIPARPHNSKHKPTEDMIRFNHTQFTRWTYISTETINGFQWYLTLSYHVYKAVVYSSWFDIRFVISCQGPSWSGPWDWDDNLRIYFTLL